MTSEDKVDDEFMEKAAMISMEWFDITPVAKALAEQYQQGFDAGKKQASTDAEQLKAEFERGRESYRDELLAAMKATAGELNYYVAQQQGQKPIAKPPIASSIEERSPEVRSVAIAKPAPEKSPRPNPSGRPDGLPRNVEMAIEAIKELDGKASSSQILAYIRKKWWAGFSSNWTAQLYDFVNQGKLARDGINFIVAIEPQILPKEPSKALMPAVRPTAPPRIPEPGKKLGPPARSVLGEMFKHGDREVMLHPREYLLTSKLYGVKGQHIGTQFLAQNALGIKNRGTDSEALIRDLVSIINPKIEGMGLKIGFYKGAGFIMQDAG